MALVPELQDLLDAALRRHDIPGAAVGVARGGERVVAAAGVLNRNTGVAVTPDSLFQIGSVTKRERPISRARGLQGDDAP